MLYMTMVRGILGVYLTCIVFSYIAEDPDL